MGYFNSEKTQVHINLSHLAHNARVLKKHLGSSFYCPVVKTDGYGHNLSLIIPILEKEDIDAIVVSSIDEGVCVRSLLKRNLTILVFAADYSRSEVQACFDHQLTPVIGQMSDFYKFKNAHKHLDIHLKFNTGLYCYGFSVEEAEFIKNQLSNNSYLQLKGVSTHLAKSYDAGVKGGCTFLQQKEFSQIQKIFGDQNYHYQNSACLLLQGDIGIGARPGIALYGIIPPTCRPVSIDLKPVMSFETRLVNIRKIKKGTSVSYGHEWTAKRSSTIGLIPVGYSDGLKRHLSPHQMYFLVEGQRAPQIGVIRMNCCLLDLTDIKTDLQIGTKVVIFGRSQNAYLSVEEQAGKLSMTAYELLTSIRPNIVRIPVESKKWQGRAGFEPATYGFGVRCSTKLSYYPTFFIFMGSQDSSLRATDFSVRCSTKLSYYPTFFIFMGSQDSSLRATDFSAARVCQAELLPYVFYFHGQSDSSLRATDFSAARVCQAELLP